MPNAAFSREAQKLGLGAQVTLFEIDMTTLGGPLLHLVPMNNDPTAGAMPSANMVTEQDMTKWFAGGSVTQIVDDFGYTVGDSDGANWEYVYYGLTPSAGTMTFAIRVQKDLIGKSTRFMVLRCTNNGVDFDLMLDTATGEFTEEHGAGTLVAHGVIEEERDWLLYGTITAVAAGTTLTLYPAAGAGAFSVGYDPSVTGSVSVKQPMFFAGAITDLVTPPLGFGGQAYTPFPIDAQGFEWKGGQAPPQPTVSIANIDHALTGYVLQYDHLIGAKFTRIRTFERFLDNGEEPDSNACMPLDIYRFDKKTAHTDVMISWQLAAWIDQQGVQLPKRMVVRDYCDFAYRNGSSGTFDYSKANCPYTGAAMFDALGNSVSTPQEDICAHTLKACKLRFGIANLPFDGFPGVAKFRV